MISKNIISKFIETVQTHPEKVAMIYKNDTFFNHSFENVTYSQLYQDVIFTAKRLKDRRFKKADRILVFVPMSYELYVIALAILYIGAVLVFVDAWSSRNRLSLACDIVKPVGFIGILKAHLLRFSAAIKKIPIKLVSQSLIANHRHLTNDMEASMPETVSDENEAIVTFTTGSTGAPKAARRTHGFLWNQYLALNAHMPLSKNDINFATLPIFVLNNLSLGITSVLPEFNPAKPSDFNPQKLVQQIIDLNISSSIGSPAFFERLANHILITNTFTPFKTIYTGGAPIFKPLALKIRQAFPETDVHVVYGATEVEPISSIPLNDYIQTSHHFGLPVGKKVNTLKIKIIRPSDEAIIINDKHPMGAYESPENEVGEIIVSGDHVLKEYIGSPLMFKKNKIVCGTELWHRTGDAGKIDSNGMIYLHGRVKNRFFNKHQNNIFALPIEHELLKIHSIAFAAIFQANEKIYVALESDKKLSEAEQISIKSEVNKKFQELIIEKIIFLKNIPRDPRHHSKANYEKLIQLKL
ncbi:MAG: AMP-binding protein [Candidatus Magnetomorum sp.]|nr:AMP-binding protein [Candidatus Magnetomorum sp.]